MTHLSDIPDPPVSRLGPVPDDDVYEAPFSSGDTAWTWRGEGEALLRV